MVFMIFVWFTMKNSAGMIIIATPTAWLLPLRATAPFVVWRRGGGGGL